MLIRKVKKNEGFIKAIDAGSRLSIWGINHGDSPQIAKLGLSKTSEGIVSRDGRSVIMTDSPGLTTGAFINADELRQLCGAAPQFANLPDQLGAYCLTCCKRLRDIAPPEIINVFRSMGSDIDIVYAAEKMGLNRRDMDKVSGPKLYRSFSDSTLYRWLTEQDFCCMKADGTFNAMYGFVGCEIFELKAFKFFNTPEEYLLPFSPTTSAVDIPFNFNGIFSTDALIVKSNNRDLAIPGMGWLLITDGAENLDWEKIENKTTNASILWADFPDDPLLSKSNFAETLAVVTEAKRRDIQLNIMRATAIGEGCNGWYIPVTNTLTESEIKKISRRYKLDLDPVWDDFPSEICCINNEKNDVPEFWHWDFYSGFYGKNTFKFMQRLIEDFAKYTDKNVLLLVPEKAKNLGRAFGNINIGRIITATYAALNNEELFLKKASSLVDVILIAEVSSAKETFTDDMLKTCLRADLPIGIFSDNDDANPRWSEWTSEKYLVRVFDANVFAVKGMNAANIKKYDFSGAELSVSQATEDDMRNGE